MSLHSNIEQVKHYDIAVVFGKNSAFKKRCRTQSYFLSFPGYPYVPESCCHDNKRICQGSEAINGPPTLGPPINKNYQRNEYLYTDGCYDKVIVHVERNALILGAVAAFVPLLLVGNLDTV